MYAIIQLKIIILILIRVLLGIFIDQNIKPYSYCNNILLCLKLTLNSNEQLLIVVFYGHFRKNQSILYYPYG